MKFDYENYVALLDKLKSKGYAFSDYRNYDQHDRCVILRHDIDCDLNKAVRFAEIEAGFGTGGVHSTYFVLLKSDLYNAASASSQRALRRIRELGHEIGLHFDEAAYAPMTGEECVKAILKEKNFLSELLDTDVTAVSMHRPSKATLQADLRIPGMINSYGHEFFHGFKYLSDSRRRWREPIDEIVESGKYDKLHILTHAFWYHDTEISIGETVSRFIHAASAWRYAALSENFTDLESIMGKEEV